MRRIRTHQVGISLSVFSIFPFVSQKHCVPLHQRNNKNATNMKLLHYSLTALSLLSALAFTSCREWEDNNQSMALSGEWRGNFGMYYDYVDARGNVYTFDSYDTYLTFIPAYNYATYGRGTQVDYYTYGPYEYQYYQFNWEVRGGIIYLDYPYDPDLNTSIRDYRMNYDYFTGYCSGATQPFRLYKLTDFYDWSPYSDRYGYYYRDNWGNYYPYYAPATRSDADAPADSASANGSVLKRGRRVEYNEK